MRYLAVVILLFITSCNFIPKLEKPKIEPKEKWQVVDERISKSEELTNNWWDILQDEVLNDLVFDAIKHNHDIKIAAANIERSRLEHNIAISDLLPDLDYNLSGKRTGYSEKISSNKNGSNFDSSFDLSWEFDLFGKIRSNSQSAFHEYLSKIDSRNAVALSVASQIIKNYVELRSYQKLEDTTIQNIKLLEQTIRLTKVRESVGIATNFDVARASSQKEIIEATLPNIKGEIFTRIYKISVLIGKNPSYLKDRLIKHQKLPNIIDPINVGLPSDLLKRRPDIKSAYNLMLARNADIGGAFAEFFPSVSLTGAVGNSSKKFSDLFSSNSSAWQYGFDLNLPIFRAGELISNYNITKEDKKIAILNYEKTVLNAFMEVETSLIKYGKEIQTRDRLRRAVRNNKRIVNLSEQRYQAGLDDLLAVIDVKRNLIEVENALIESETRVLVNLTELYKALGGGIKGDEIIEEVSELENDDEVDSDTKNESIKESKPKIRTYKFKRKIAK